MNSYSRRKWAIRIITGFAIFLVLAFSVFIYLANQYALINGSVS